MIKKLIAIAAITLLGITLSQAAQRPTRFVGKLYAEGKPGQTVTLTSQLEIMAGSPKHPWEPFAGQSVTLTVGWGFKLGKTQYYSKTNAKGVVTFVVTIPTGTKGNKSCKVHYDGVGSIQSAGRPGMIVVKP